jgi:hypothetical protein
MSFLDRSNIGNARLAGLEKDLNMHGLDYNVWLIPSFRIFSGLFIPGRIGYILPLLCPCRSPFESYDEAF